MNKDNTVEESLFQGKITEEEAAMLSDIEILALLIAERRTRLAADQAQRMALIRRKRTAAAGRR